MRALDIPSSRVKTALPRLLSVLVISAVLFTAALVIWVAGFQAFYAGRILPGVSVSGVDLSGLKPDAAAARLSQQITYPASGKILLQDRDKSWVVSPAELGYFLDPRILGSAGLPAGAPGWFDRTPEPTGKRLVLRA